MPDHATNLAPFAYPANHVAYIDSNWMFYSDARWHHLGAPYDPIRQVFVPKDYHPRAKGANKLHISTHIDDTPAAWNAIVGFILSNRLRAKVGTRTTLEKFVDPAPDSRHARQRGKMITIYIDDQEAGPDTHQHWLDLFAAVEDALHAAHVRPMDRPPENHAIGSRGYLSFRGAYDARDPDASYQRANLASPDAFAITTMHS